MNKKGFVNIIFIVFVIALTVTIGYLTLVKKPTEQTLFTQNDGISSQTTPFSTGTLEWKKYSGSSLEFEYPSLILVKQEGEIITLNHFIDYEHPNPCDFKGDTPSLEKFSDFGVSLTVFNKNLKDAVQSNEGSDYVVNNFFENDTLKLSKWFIDKFSAGSMSGFQITSVVEGCGRYAYYFPIASTKTLVVNRSFISEFSSVDEDYQAYPDLLGVILPNQEKEFFIEILSSLKVKT